MSALSHINAKGEANMVDVSNKPVTTREAKAQAVVKMQAATLAMISAGQHAKGDVLAVARVAGIQAAKKCADLIPLCHPLALSKVSVSFDVDPVAGQVRVEAYCKLAGQTGVEMEALSAASVAALTLFDMCKAVDKHMQIDGIRVLSKGGGQSVDWPQQDAKC